jgi:phosphoribulokinase
VVYFSINIYTTEFIRNKSVDITIISLIIQNRITVFTVDEAYEKIHKDLPIRKEEIEKSFHRMTPPQIASFMGMDTRTVKKLLEMSEHVYSVFN